MNYIIKLMNVPVYFSLAPINTWHSCLVCTRIRYQLSIYDPISLMRSTGCGGFGGHSNLYERPVLGQTYYERPVWLYSRTRTKITADEMIAEIKRPLVITTARHDFATSFYRMYSCRWSRWKDFVVISGGVIVIYCSKNWTWLLRG